MTSDETITVENVNVPGQVTRANAAKYRAMNDALRSVLPTSGPGITQKEMLEAVKPLLPDNLFPGGKTSGWWVKTVQLDLEAKGLVVRVVGRPTRWSAVASGEA